MRRALTYLFTCAIAALGSLAWSAPAHALTGGYASHAWAGCTSGFNSGGWDDAGRVYVPCGNPTSIGVYDATGRMVQAIHLDFWVSDVAPTRDGAYLYVATADAPRRLVRTADGSYAIDTTWSADAYGMYGRQFPARGRFVTTDAAGRLYLADGYWSPNETHTVIVYDPSGNVLTRFGEWSDESWDPGDFYWALGGVAVTADGATVWTTEAGNNRLQRWTRQPGGHYLPTATFGGTAANNATRAGFCDYAGWLGKFAAPYDVALDQAGSMYVINTTCKQVLRFAPGPGALRANLDVRVNGADYPRPHGFAVGADGTVYVGENQRVLRPAGGSIPADGRPPVRPAPPTTQTGGGSTGTNPVVQPPTTQPTLDTRAPVVALGRARTYRTRTGGLVRVPARCNERCRVEVRVFQRRRMIARRVTWIPRGVQRRLDVRLGRRVRTGPVALRVTVRDAAGNRSNGAVGRTARVLAARR